MLTCIEMENFKRFRRVLVELGDITVLVGPNNSGKTSTLQALALWELGLRRWLEKRGGRDAPEKRPGVTLNRRDIVSLPVPEASLLWRDLHVRSVERVDGKQRTQNVRITIRVDGISAGAEWMCALEFDFANAESIYCRPVLGQQGKRLPIPRGAEDVRVAFLPPMSGLAANELRLDPGAVHVRIGEGRTAEVLRNLCLRVADDSSERWGAIVKRIKDLFGVVLDPPRYVKERGEIAMSYLDLGDVKLDLSASGRGLQQTLLLLAYIHANPGCVLLLDEPDAHLEILRQRQTYEVLVDAAREHGNQIIAASHSEVLLNEAADRDVVIAFVGRPHRIDDRGSQVLKSLKDIGFEQYYQAEQMGWVLYLEGSTDLAILQALARALHHPAAALLDRPFVHYVGNQPPRAESHFFGLREAKRDLVGFALYDRLDRPPDSRPGLMTHVWRRKEIENYIATPENLLDFAATLARPSNFGPLFDAPETRRLRDVMAECIHDLVPRLALTELSDPFWIDGKASEFLDRLFQRFFGKLGLPDVMRKADYDRIARVVPKDRIDAEVVATLDSIVEVQSAAHPAESEELPT